MKKTKKTVLSIDVKEKVVAGVNKLAAIGIEKALSYLPKPARGFAAPILENGMNALLNALGVKTGKDPSDTKKILEELEKIKKTLQELSQELNKINDGINMLAELVTRETERINQAAKYRDYVRAKESIETNWTIIWAHINSVSKNAGDKDTLEEALKLYQRQTVNFVKDILDNVKLMGTSVLKMFDDRESLFHHMTDLSINLNKADILTEAKGIYSVNGKSVDSITFTQANAPEIWEKLLEGPCGLALKNPEKYPDSNFKHLPQHWQGDNWFLYMDRIKPIIEQHVNQSPVSVFFSEINMMIAKSLMMLAVIYRDNEGLAEVANEVIKVMNNISNDANSNASRYIDTLHKWLMEPGKWRYDARERPYPDSNTVFGLWANRWIDPANRLAFPGTYVEKDSSYYPCSIFYNLTKVEDIAKNIWNKKPPYLLLYYVNDKDKLVFDFVFKDHLSENVPTWFKRVMKNKETALQKTDKFVQFKTKASWKLG